MERVRDLIAGGESWLAERVLEYAVQDGYGMHASALADIWRASISDLSASLLSLSAAPGRSPELPAGEDFPSGPVSAFGVLEARRHRDRGIDPRLSLLLMKFYRRSFVDLVLGAGFPPEERETRRRSVERFFDHAEVAFCLERERASRGRSRYLAFFESLPGPAFLLDAQGRVENMNRAAAAMLGEDTLVTGTGCAEERRGKPLAVFAEELARFQAAEVPSRGFEKAVDTPMGMRHYQGEMHRILEGSGKFEGTAILLTDLTRRKEAEETLQVVLEEMEARVAERTADAVRSHNLLNAVIADSTDAIYLKDLDGRYLMVNPAGAEFVGKPVEEIIGKYDRDLFSPDCASVMTRWDREIVRTGATRTYEEAVTSRGGNRVFSTSKGPWRDGGGKVIGVFGVTRDVTGRKRGEEALRMANRALRMLWKCSRALLRAKDESELLSDVCRIVVEEGGYRLAWAGFAEDDPGKSVRPVAQFGLEEGNLETLALTWEDTARGRGPTGTAIRTGAPVVARDIHTDPSFEPWRAEALRRGYASSVSLPFGGRLGALNIYSPAPDAFSPEDVLLLSELADMLAYGIRSLRAKPDRPATG